jgi:hypothetical protein
MVALLACLTPLAAEAKKKDKAAKDESQKEEEKWDVANPPGEWSWKTITIDTDETTWSDVDVSPDGRSIVFDMLGDICGGDDHLWVMNADG